MDERRAESFRLMDNPQLFRGSHDGLVEWLQLYVDLDSLGHEYCEFDYVAGKDRDVPFRSFEYLFPKLSREEYLGKRIARSFAEMRGPFYCGIFQPDYEIVQVAWIAEFEYRGLDPVSAILEGSRAARKRKVAPPMYRIPEQDFEEFQRRWDDNNYGGPGVYYSSWKRWGHEPRMFGICFADLMRIIDWFAEETGMGFHGLRHHAGFLEILRQYIPKGDQLESIVEEWELWTTN